MHFREMLGLDAARARLAAAVSGFALGAEQEEILAPTRGAAAAAFARQLAMYLAHVAFEMSLSRIAIAFGRDRSTVAHACHLIEDRRDDAAFDAWIDGLEAMLREAPPPRSGARLVAHS